MNDTKQLSHYIDGQWVPGAAASESLNPSDTRDIVAKVPGGDKSTVNAAVSAAKAAFPAWANASPEVRSDLLDKVGSLIMARADDLGRLLSREEGKTLPEGKGEVMRAARIFKYFAGEALRRHGVTRRFHAAWRRGGNLSRTARRLRVDNALEFPHCNSGMEERAGARVR